MSDDQRDQESATTAEADVANGEAPQPPSAAPRGSGDQAKGRDDPDAPGLSTLGEQPGEPVEPNEPG